MTEDEFYMERALALAAKGAGRVNPNPLVGAVIVKDGSIIGEGYHMQYGGLHAERNALAGCAQSAKGAIMYVTLEPCCHYGKTPPCTEALIKHGISKVVIGMRDPNPLVAGKGIRILEDAGISVTEGILEQKCRDLNRIFIHYITTKTPYITMKYAMTMDGRTATRTGASKWITSVPARVRVHEDRSRHMAIMAGKGTVLADDPMLNCRIPGGRQPIRVICDTWLTIPVSSRVVATAKELPTWILTCEKDTGHWKPYEEKGCRIISVPMGKHGVDLQEAVRLLGEKGIDSIYLEGGSELHASALEAGLVQEIHTYIAPKLFGGKDARTPIAGQGVELPSQAYRMEGIQVERIGEDILIRSRVFPGEKAVADSRTEMRKECATDSKTETQEDRICSQES